MSIVFQTLFILSAFIFSVMTLRALICLRWVHRLPAEKQLNLNPKVSVIFAARDEEARVETTVRRILAQEGVDLEVIPVDDRSRDGTSQIFKRLSAEDSRVRPKRIDSLPEDWLGKCHACHVGASSATGEWFLFTDADCWLKSDVLARALGVAEREGVQHVTLTPGVAPETMPAAAWHLAFLITVVDWIARTNQDKPKGYLGTGAFNLVSAETYRKFGGHETLRLSVLEDVKLGKLVRKSGGRTRAFVGGDDVECHWGVTVPQMIKIMEKNYFAAIDFHTFAGLFLGPFLIVIWSAAIIGPFTGTLAGVAAGVAFVSCIIPAFLLAKRLGWGLREAIFTPFVFVALYYAILNSTVVTLKQGGIHWRDTFYPLKKLRAGNVY